MKYFLRKESLRHYTTNPDDPNDLQGVHAYYRSIIQAMPNNVYWLDRNCVTLGCNENVLKLLNLDSYEQFIGITYEEMAKLGKWTHGEAESFKRDDMEVMQTGRPKLNIEDPPVYDEHGKATYYLSSRVPIKDDQGQVIGVIGISVDISSKKEAEKLRLEKKVAEERAETIKLIAASIAHELRTPLRAIDAGIMGIEKYIPDLIVTYKNARKAEIDTPHLNLSDIKLLDRIFAIIHSETKAAFNIIDMLLVKADLAHIKTAEFKICSMKTCIDEALNRYHFDSNQKTLIHVKPTYDFDFNGNHLLAVHVIFNLLKNALYHIKAANKGQVDIWLQKNPQSNELHFKDTGTGIPADVLPYIFDRFYSNTTHGAGVGLAFCKMVMQSFGGDIVCNSVEGEYTEFLLTFPPISDRL